MQLFMRRCCSAAVACEEISGCAVLQHSCIIGTHDHPGVNSMRVAEFLHSWEGHLTASCCGAMHKGSCCTACLLQSRAALAASCDTSAGSRHLFAAGVDELLVLHLYLVVHAAAGSEQCAQHKAWLVGRWGRHNVAGWQAEEVLQCVYCLRQAAGCSVCAAGP
jgi:hypothetical protein